MLAIGSLVMRWVTDVGGMVTRRGASVGLAEGWEQLAGVGRKKQEVQDDWRQPVQIRLSPKLSCNLRNRQALESWFILSHTYQAGHINLRCDPHAVINKMVIKKKNQEPPSGER